MFYTIISICSMMLAVNDIVYKTPLENDNYFIRGSINELPNNTIVYLIKRSDRNGELDTIDVVKSEKGKFVLKGKYNAGELNFVKIDTSFLKLAPGKRSDIVLVIDNRKIDVSGNLDEWPIVNISGSKATSEYLSLVDTIIKFNDRIRNKMKNSPSNKPMEIITEYSQGIKNILLNYPNSYATPIVAKNYTTVLVNQQIKELYNGLTERVKNSIDGKILKSFIEFKTLSEAIRPGREIHNFEVNNENGEKVSIKDLISKNKLTLIDFWASWCSPCRAEIPNLKKAYGMFHDRGFNIISISIDNRMQDWLSALEKEKMIWRQGVDLKQKVSNDIFGIKAIPAYVLVDENGSFIAFNCYQSQIESFGPYIRGDSLIPVLERLLR